MLLDPLCVGATCNRMDTHFWAKSTLFKGAMGWLFRQLGAVSSLPDRQKVFS